MVILSVPILLVVIVDYFLVAINVYSIDDYFLRGYWWLLVIISCYCIDGYQWLLYWCLLMVIILMIIGDYSINGY
jgi:hypothetical protein